MIVRQRIPQTNVYYYKSPEHNDNYVLSFAFAFDKDGEKYQFSMIYPYNYSRCQEFLEQLSKKDVDFLSRETLLKTTVISYNLIISYYKS